MQSSILFPLLPPVRAARGAILVLCVAAAASVGCGSSSAAPPANASSATASAGSEPAGTEVGADDDGSQLVEHHRHHHGGVAMFLHMSLDSIGATDDQKAALTKIQDDLAAKLEPEHAAQQAVLTLLADGVAAGAVDKAKVDAAIATVDANAASSQAATTDALNQLHSVLTPPQRIALMQKIEAHWQVWQRANAEEEPQGAGHEHGPFAMLAKDLSLTPDQADKIKASLHAGSTDAPKKLDPAEVDGHLKTFGTAFEGETFDAKTVNNGEGMNVHLASHGIRRMARFYEAAAPVLTPDQRTKLSARLREHAGQEGK